jgi:hypothetical protein
MTKVNAKSMVKNGFPTDEGKRLAEELLCRDGLNFRTLSVDLTECDSAMLISAFFNAFLQTVHEQVPARLDEAREIAWELEFDFQRENVAEWMKDFEPFSVH